MNLCQYIIIDIDIIDIIPLLVSLLLLLLLYNDLALLQCDVIIHHNAIILHYCTIIITHYASFFGKSYCLILKVFTNINAFNNNNLQ